MPLSKDQKHQLAQQYAASIAEARNAVIIKKHGIPVNEINAVRMDLEEANGSLQTVKKRVFLKGIEGKLEGVTIEEMDGAVALLYSHNEDDQHAPLKVLQKHKKAWKKANADYEITFVGGWYDSVRQGAEYVNELADLPSKEELIGKFLFMLNHPVSSLARALKAIADKDGEVAEATPAEAKAEESTEGTSQEAPVEETPAEENKNVGDAPEETGSESDAPAEEAKE